MRDPNRLNDFYNEVARLHSVHFPDWRAGQFWLNFLGWLNSEKKRDPFFSEESEMLKYLREFCGEENKEYGK